MRRCLLAALAVSAVSSAAAANPAGKLVLDEGAYCISLALLT
jgi:hypothetical protein